MQKFITAVAAAAVILAAGTGSASALTRNAKIDNDQAYHERLIEMGRYRGDLTRREYRNLRAEQSNIEAMELDAKDDGYMSRREFRKIRRAQQDAYDNILVERDDHQRALWRTFLYRIRF